MVRDPLVTCELEHRLGTGVVIDYDYGRRCREIDATAAYYEVLDED